MNPETSVIIPVRNGERFVAEAIRSALVQLGPADEVLVVDDASNDATRAVVKAIGDGRVTILDGAGKGVSAARNIGLAAARGEFVAFLDHDDLWTERRHPILRAALAADPDLGAAYGRLRVRFEADAPPSWTSTYDGKHICLQIGSGLYRRTALDRVVGFDESLKTGEDVDYFVRLSEAGMTTLDCDVDGLVYRRYRDNLTNDPRVMKQGLLPMIRRRLARTAPINRTEGSAPAGTRPAPAATEVSP